MLTKVQIIMNNSVNPILLRPVHGIVLAINSVLLKLEQLCHGYNLIVIQLAFSFWWQSIYKTTQGLA